MNQEKSDKTGFKKYTKWIWAGVLFLAAIGDAATGLQVIRWVIQNLDFIFNLPLIVKLLFIAFIITSVAIIVNYANKDKKAPPFTKYLLALSTIMGIIIILPLIREQPQRKFVIVYDEVEPLNNLGSEKFKVEIRKLDGLFQTNETGELDNSIIISTVNRPALKWRNEFPNKSKISSPIFSIQEVIESSQLSNLVDISLLSHSNEIIQCLKLHCNSKSDIRIFYESGYEYASQKLKEDISKEYINSTVNIIAFDNNGILTMISQEATIIFLGKTETYRNTIKNIDDNKYRLLITPNWIRPEIIEKSNIEGSKRICTLSSYFNKLITNDYSSWDKLLKTFRDDETNFNSSKSVKDLENRIKSGFAINNNIIYKHF